MKKNLIVKTVKTVKAKNAKKTHFSYLTLTELLYFFTYKNRSQSTFKTFESNISRKQGYQVTSQHHARKI